MQAERLDLLSSLQQLPLKVRTEEQEAILQGMSRAEMGEAANKFPQPPKSAASSFIVGDPTLLYLIYKPYEQSGCMG